MASRVLSRAGRCASSLISRSARAVASVPPVVSVGSAPASAPSALPAARTSPALVSARAPLGLSRSVRTYAVSGDAMKVPLEPESLPSVAVSAAPLAAFEGDLLVLGVTEEDFATEGEVTAIKTPALQEIDASLGGVLSELVAAGGVDGKPGSQSRVVRLGGGSKVGARWVALVGLGKGAKLSAASEWGASPFQGLGNAVATLAKANRAVTAAVALLGPWPETKAAAVSQIATGALLGGYETTRFKSKKSPTASKLGHLTILADLDAEAGAAAAARGVSVARGNLMTRYLVEAPPNVCTPTHLADTAKLIADAAPDVYSLRVYEKAECEEMKMGLFLGVAEASAEPLKFIHLKYSPPGGSASRKVAVVGKGLTFDSGGYNLKAGAGSMIEMMKFDMGGAGATLGAARILADLKPAGVEAHFIIAACENMVAGEGLRPGDILTAASGKTVEVNNTDAEGRLTLADAMWFAQEKCGVTSVVDIATLTGACMVALGMSIAGLMTPSEPMASSLQAAAKAAGEKVWRLPLEAEYFDSLKSPIADMKNTGARTGGAITAGLFLQQFVNEGVEWAHLDVAGPVWSEKANVPTGFGAALLAEWLIAQGAAPAK